MDYFLIHNLATLVTTAVWPDLAKFHHFGKKIHSFAAFGKILDQLWAILSAYLVFGKIFNQLWQRNVCHWVNFLCRKWTNIGEILYPKTDPHRCI